MANIIIKSEERRQAEETVRRSFGVTSRPEDREAVEVIARRSEEAYAESKRMEGRRSW
mgnify:FL=1